MDFTKILTAGLVVLIATGGVAAAGSGVGTQAASSDATSTTNVDAHATFNNGTATVTVADAGEPLENVSVYADDEQVGVTDANGTLTFDSNTSEELEIELVGHDFEGELEYHVQNGSLTLTEEEYEYEEEHEEEHETETEDEHEEEHETEDEDEDENEEEKEHEEEHEEE